MPKGMFLDWALSSWRSFARSFVLDIVPNFRGSRDALEKLTAVAVLPPRM